MKKKYEKPVMVSEEFAIGNHIAHGGCNHKPNTNGPKPYVDVDCKYIDYWGFKKTDEHRYQIFTQINSKNDYDNLVANCGHNHSNFKEHKYDGIDCINKIHIDKDKPWKHEQCKPFSS